MENLFSSSSAEKIIRRIGTLQAGSKPLWGKMDAAQMLAHCQVPIKVGLGDVSVKRTLIGLLFGGMIKRQFLKGKPFQKNLPTDKSFIMADAKNFEIEKHQLVTIIHRFTNAESTVFSKKIHPFFGKMTADEWGTLTWKHLDHHLQQFGV